MIRLYVVILFALVTHQVSAAPNVVVIMTDNHGAWTLGCYGNPDIRTPHIDQLASEGTLFSHAFASNPVCSPTRATCLTGLIPSQHGVHSFLRGGNLQTGPNARCTLDEITSLPEVLKAQGYACGLVGKWHLGGNISPQEGLDDYWITMPHGGTSTFYDAQVIQDGKIRKEPKYMTDLWTEHAVNFIEQESQTDDPFFLFLSYNGPYSLSRLLLKDGKNRHAEYYRDKPIDSFPRETPHPWQLNNLDFINNPTSIRRVATEVSGVDDGVGTVMSALKQNGIDDNTIVIFLADQGWVGGHGGFFGMGDHTRPLTARDGMMQIPMIWRHPKQIAAGKRSSQMIANYDVMPTLLGHLDMADKMPTAPRSPGSDLSNAFQKESTDVSRPIFYEYENLRCIRTETAKYVHRHPNGPHELYDLVADPDEFVNLVADPNAKTRRDQLKHQLDGFFGQFAEPKYDMWNGGTSQVRIHDGIDEEIAQLTAVSPPKTPEGFTPAPLQVPEGFTVELVAGPPLIKHPTMGCFDDQGRLYVCNNAGVNLTSDELEKQLPNSICLLTDRDNDGHFDDSTVFADKMTFPMGGAWHDGSLYVASPPNIWKLTDTDHDGVADQREIIVKQFGYNGNAASIHGCFFGDDGRMYWCDGFHGHEFTDDEGNVTSKREGSYIFSCLPDGSDVQILAGGGMDNPVEVDLTEEGDVLGTVNILYTRPREDCFVHWLHGGAYPHRERVLDELKVTGDVLGPAHRFGHVAVSGTTRYRSGALDHQWRNHWFTTFFNQGKVVRLELARAGSTWEATQHEFLTSTSREFHPTDVIEDADGSLLVIDTGGWFYRGCPTSQFAKPDVLGGIYRVRRSGMTPLVDPRGTRINWAKVTKTDLARFMLNDTRFAVRQRAIGECSHRGEAMIPTLASYVVRGDIRVRRGCLWALIRLAQQKSTSVAASAAIIGALNDRLPSIRQLACRGLRQSVHRADPGVLESLLGDTNAGVRREAATTLGKLGGVTDVAPLVDALARAVDRSEEHAITYALIEINEFGYLSDTLRYSDDPKLSKSILIAMDQMDQSELVETEVLPLLSADDAPLRLAALKIVKRHPEWDHALKALLVRWLADANSWEARPQVTASLVSQFANDEFVAAKLGDVLGDVLGGNRTELVMRALKQVPDLKLHDRWIDSIRNQLTASDPAKVELAMDVVGQSKSQALKDALIKISRDESVRDWLRVRALEATQTKKGPASAAIFELLKAVLDNTQSPRDVAMAAKYVSSISLSLQQRLALLKHLKSASATELRDLIKVYSRLRDEDSSRQFLTSVGNAKAFLSLPESEFSDVIKRYPQAVLPQANELLDRLKQHAQSQRDKLTAILPLLKQGDATRGQLIFASEKTKCASCHRVGDLGKRVGPDLTTIGANRSASDLLESIVLPSASIVRDYDTRNILTVDGMTISGLLIREDSTSATLQQSTGETVTVPVSDIQQSTPHPISIMPTGYSETLTPQQLADLVAYLRQLR